MAEAPTSVRMCKWVGEWEAFSDAWGYWNGARKSLIWGQFIYHLISQKVWEETSNCCKLSFTIKSVIRYTNTVSEIRVHFFFQYYDNIYFRQASIVLLLQQSEDLREFPNSFFTHTQNIQTKFWIKFFWVSFATYLLLSATSYLISEVSIDLH